MTFTELKIIRWLFRIECKHEFREPQSPNVCKPTIYCIHCGEIKKLPENHKWERASTSYVGGVRNEKGDITQWQHRTFHLKCERCGNRKSTSG
jgi:hypothetical protein